MSDLTLGAAAPTGVCCGMDRAEQIEMIRRHLAAGERHVASQREIVRRFREIGADTELAEDLLEEFEATLAQHQEHLAQLLDT